MIAAGSKACTSIADAGADVGERSARVALGARRNRPASSSSCCRASPSNTVTVKPGPFGQRGVVGEIVAARGGGAAMRIEQRQERRRPAASARCAGARDRASPATLAVVVDELDRVGDRQRRDRGAGLAAAAIARLTSAARGERPRRVVHQHDVGRPCGERLEPGAHRGLPRCRRPRPGCATRKPCGGGGEAGGVVGMDHRQHEIDLRVARRTRAGSRAPSARRPSPCIAWDNRARRAFRARLRPPPRPRGSPCFAPALLRPNKGFSACLHHRKRIFALTCSLGILLHRSTCGAAQNG